MTPKCRHCEKALRPYGQSSNWSPGLFKRNRMICRTCNSRIVGEYYQAHREERDAYSAEYKRNNREKIRGYYATSQRNKKRLEEATGRRTKDRATPLPNKHLAPKEV
jgi:hypothetical protein